MISITLDTNCIIDLQDNQAKEFRLAMERLIQLAEDQRLDLAVTTRVESEAKDEPTIDAYRGLISSRRIKVIGSTTRLGYWRLGVDLLPDEGVWKSIARAVCPNRDPEFMFRSKGKLPKDSIDIDHLYGHLQSQRDFFVTRDGRLLRAKKRLAALGIRVCKPTEIVKKFAAGKG